MLQSTKEQFLSVVWPSLKPKLSVGWTGCSADVLYLLLHTARVHKVTGLHVMKYCGVIWNIKDISISKVLAYAQIVQPHCDADLSVFLVPNHFERFGGCLVVPVRPYAHRQTLYANLLLATTFQQIDAYAV